MILKFNHSLLLFIHNHAQTVTKTIGFKGFNLAVTDIPLPFDLRAVEFKSDISNICNNSSWSKPTFSANAIDSAKPAVITPNSILTTNFILTPLPTSPAKQNDSWSGQRSF